MSVLSALLDLAYPPLHNCLVCGAPFRPRGLVELCEGCLGALPLVRRPMCHHCGRPLRPWEVKERTKDPSCPDCYPTSGRGQRFLMARSPLVYEGLARDLLLALKFQGKYGLAEPLGQVMAAYVQEFRPFPRVDVVVPVPIHYERLQKRGYNQAQILASHVSRAARVPLADVMGRVRMSETQSLVDFAHRRENIRGCFAVRHPGEIRGKAVLLVDDIYTTGSTLDECSGELLRCGARSVVGFSAAVVVPV